MAGLDTRWIVIILMFAVPLVFGVLLIVAAIRRRSVWLRLANGLFGVLFLAGFALVAASIGPYLWALHLESKWSPAHPQTKAELESYLSLYSQHNIQPSESQWGSDHKLQSGERMTQYLILWKAPLDVVYTAHDGIVAIYTSYE